jgi:SAM-dependent methyltransferase
MSNVDYDHSQNLHTVAGPEKVVRHIVETYSPSSVLDVGCGLGTWLHNVVEAGVVDVVGIDGVAIPLQKLLFETSRFIQVDLREPFDLGRHFDLAICLEVAEHLPAGSDAQLVDSLTRHSDRILFSAGCPGQPGQNHINCHWPEYWQGYFNARGFVCIDELRWRFWADQSIEPWYRQNMFIASKDPAAAGTEPRLAAVIHPEIMQEIRVQYSHSEWQSSVKRVEQGHLPVTWYVRIPFAAAAAKLRRRIRQNSKSRV